MTAKAFDPTEENRARHGHEAGDRGRARDGLETLGVPATAARGAALAISGAGEMAGFGSAAAVEGGGIGR